MTYSNFLGLTLLPIYLFAFAGRFQAGEPSPFLTQFKEVKATNFGTYGLYTITNTSGRDIDDIVLHLFLKDSDGNILSSTAVTDSTPGLVWLKSGASTTEGVPLDSRDTQPKLY